MRQAIFIALSCLGKVWKTKVEVVMAGVEVEITGLDDVVNRLQRLANPRRTKSIARKAARQAMNIVRDAARNNAKAIDDPETSEKIWKNIKVSAGKTRNPMK
jgi:hypothetical protein